LYWQNYGNPLTDMISFYLGVEGVSKTGQTNVRNFSDSFRYFIDLPYILSKPVLILFLIGLFYVLADVVLGFDRIFKNRDIQNKFLVLFWVAILFLSLGYTSLIVEQRYIISGLPFLFLIVAIPFVKMEDYLIKNTKINKKLLFFLLILVFIGFMVPNLRWGNELIEAKKASYLEIKQAGEWLRQNTAPSSNIMTHSAPQIMYYSERDTYKIRSKNPEDFKEELKNKSIDFLVLSIYESHEEWLYRFPQENNKTLIPVQAYLQDQRPVAVIYQLQGPDKNFDISDLLNQN